MVIRERIIFMSSETFQIEVDKIDKADWNNLIAQFDDASLYQTWSYGASSKKSISHIVIRDNECTIGCCQVELKHLPFSKIGVADIVWGPLCVKKGGIFNQDVLFQMIIGIKQEYAVKRGYLLRIRPHVTGERKELLKQILESEGFKRNLSERPYRTFKLDLSPSIEDLRKNFLQKWRNCLNKAERNELKVVEGTSDELYDKFLILLDQMVERKKFKVDYGAYRCIQKDLPDNYKMKILICEANSEPVCALVCTAIGDTGIYLLGATGQKGLSLNASYLLQWYMIQWLKENGFHYYDLGAFNPELNPSVYHFKKGIAGKKECEEIFLGEYRGGFNFNGKIADFFLNYVKLLRGIF